MATVEEIVKEHCNEVSNIFTETAAEALFDAITSSQLTKERFVELVTDMVEAAYTRGSHSTQEY
jgi:hypothetical protein